MPERAPDTGIFLPPRPRAAVRNGELDNTAVFGGLDCLVCWSYGPLRSRIGVFAKSDGPLYRGFDPTLVHEVDTVYKLSLSTSHPIADVPVKSTSSATRLGMCRALAAPAYTGGTDRLSTPVVDGEQLQVDECAKLEMLGCSIVQ
ncbi:hypothetical protein CHU98_g6611 [Xylaria longipes]|nr:hypothetical protein CHU98_g6611 [Xylaria longipes]